MNINFETVSARDIQKNYRKIFDKVKNEGEPIFVMSKNKPDVVIVSLDYLNNFKDQLEWEIEDTKEAIRAYKEEKKLGKLKVMATPSELLAE